MTRRTDRADRDYHELEREVETLRETVDELLDALDEARTLRDFERGRADRFRGNSHKRSISPPWELEGHDSKAEWLSERDG